MAVGIQGTNLANAWLNTLRNTSFSVATLFVQLHTNVGDPGPNGTANVSSTTTRQALTFGAPSPAGTMNLSGTPSWTNWAGTNGEVVSYISVWSASSAGTFYFSVQLTTPKTVNTGDTLNLTSLTISLTPLAA